jgi:hypothetical protein
VKLALGLGALLSIAACSGPNPRLTAIVGASLRDEQGLERFTHSMVIVEGKQFGAVGPQSEVVFPKQALTVDARGKILMPVDEHKIEEGQPADLYLVSTLPDGAPGKIERKMIDGQWVQ